MVQNKYKLSKTSMFNMETLTTAPSDLAVTRQARKYGPLRKQLLEALNSKAWGIRLCVTASTIEELEFQVKCLRNAGANWKRSTDLCKRHGKDLHIVVRTNKDSLTAVINMVFKDCSEQHN